MSYTTATGTTVEQPTHIVVGGGSSGCVLAARLSEDPRCVVLLIEAGRDYLPDEVPADIGDTYAGHALNNPAYFWPSLRRQHASRAADGSSTAPPAANSRYEQARIIGGGSSINGQVALRGAPRDFDRWRELGASHWDWQSVLPYFRKLESDRNFSGPLHGNEGPIPIDRIDSSKWDSFTIAVTKSWAAMGHARRRDMNGTFESGYAEIPLANDGRRRVSTAVGYLGADVRRRRNLTIRTDLEVTRIVMQGKRAVGVEVAEASGADGKQFLRGDTVVLCAGAIHSPWLLLKSGIGPARHLSDNGVPLVLDLPGVGQNLQDHPSISISAYLPSHVRRKPMLRHNYVNLIYSSNEQACPTDDMVMMVVVKSAWHEVGKRIGTLSTYVGKAYSTGTVRLDERNPAAPPEVRFNWLADPRDLRRAVESFRFMARLFGSGTVPAHASNAFTVGFSEKVKRLGRKTRLNRAITWLTANAMDSSALLRHLIIKYAVAGGVTVERLLADDKRLEAYVREAVTGIWHPCGTCRMGAAGDPASVTDSEGRVIGAENLVIADASVIPEIPTTNLNLPTIMVAEKIADMLKARLPRAMAAEAADA